MHFSLAVFHRFDQDIDALMAPYNENLEVEPYYDPEFKEMTTYNPKSKWDWWVVGGRWDGDLIMSSYGSLLRWNECKVSDIYELPPTHSVLTPDGKWYEKEVWYDEADKQKAEVPIIAVTANAFEEDRKLAMEAGMNGHLAKPYDIPKMLETLGTFLK